VVPNFPHPVGGVDYPRTLVEFNEWFPSEKACAQFVADLRWPDGFRCPACGGEKNWPTKRGELRCGGCQRQTSVTAGTIFDKTRKPLRHWFQAMWYVTNQKVGGSALGLQRALGLGSYQTAWAWLHKMRRAMVRPGRDRLTGCVEVDETYIGGDEEDVRGRQTERKAIVAIAVEVQEPKGFGRVRLRRIADCSASSLTPFVCAAIEAGSEVRTDGWRGYNQLAAKGFRHIQTVLAAREEPAHVVMPAVHRVASLLKRWLLGTHQGAVSAEHLDYYLDEYTFRFNRRKSRARGLLFYRLVAQAVQVDPIRYRQLVGGQPLPTTTDRGHES
jgi:transposase-like protein